MIKNKRVPSKNKKTLVIKKTNDTPSRVELSGKIDLESKRNKQVRIDFSDEINLESKRNKQETIALWALIISVITLFAYILPIPSYTSSIVASFQKDEHIINIEDGGLFEFYEQKIHNDRFVYVEQQINSKLKKDRGIFSHKILNIGLNYLSNYKNHIIIVDPIGRVRGKLILNIEGNNEDKKFNTIFKFPPSNEKLYGEWNIYSYIYRDNITYSVIKTPFQIKQPEPEYMILFPIIMTFSMLIIMRRPRFVRFKFLK